MSIFRNIFGLLTAVVLGLLYMSYFIVTEKQKALVQRFGEINRVIEEPGLYFKLPIADTVSTIDDRIMVWSMDNRTVQDNASQVYIVDAVTLARVQSARLFRETLQADPEQAKLRISNRLDSALRQTYGRRSFNAALSSDRTVMMKEIADELRKEAAGFGIDIVDVRVQRTDLPEEVLKDTYTRMESERNKLSGDIRSEGQALSTRRKAETDRAVTEQVARASRDAEIISGQGDAERNRIFAEAFQKDPEFFSFYRSMLAYQKSLGTEGTTLVLDPKSDFFKYFGTQKDRAQVPTQP
jgi:membrane protease subunit HflC